MKNNTYDSTEDTMKHIYRVEELLNKVSELLSVRGYEHDQSKLISPEKELFDEMTTKLKEVKYGSEEYKECLNKLKPALDHHYANNSHHPEHYPNGINGMCLIDLIEMLADWKAAGERHADGGDIMRSIEINSKRFNIDPQLKQILINTVKYL